MQRTVRSDSRWMRMGRRFFSLRVLFALLFVASAGCIGCTSREGMEMTIDLSAADSRDERAAILISAARDSMTATFGGSSWTAVTRHMDHDVNLSPSDYLIQEEGDTNSYVVYFRELDSSSVGAVRVTLVDDDTVSCLPALRK
jgi:hypothetical protein